MSPFDFHENYLAALEDASQRRILSQSNGIIFSSNDYLGLAHSEKLNQETQEALQTGVPIGSRGSRLLSGNHHEHEALEREAADFFQSQSALFFANGYAANMALLSTLPQKEDIIFYDALIHASSHDGMRLSRAPSQCFAHNDVGDLEHRLKQWRSKNNNPTARIWILFETLYSMDGDIAPIDALNDIAQKYGAVMMIDEAHATGVYGPDGRGLAAHLDAQDNSIILRTCGKALGCEGALICLPKIAKDFMINRARHFIFSTAPSPLMANIVRASLRILQSEPERRERLKTLTNYATQKLTPLGANSHGTPIIPIIIGDAKRTMDIAKALQAGGFDILGIRPPTVAQGTSRLRICISLNITENDIDKLAQAISDLL